jgi:CRISPR system Cascade subunit CasC
LRQGIADWLKTEKKSKNLAAMQHGSGLESALFGRMVTSDVLTSRDASVYVSHAFTVHEAQVENDYFTVVDDLTSEAGELGSAGIFDTELASGLYYGYVVVDVRQLVANLEGIKIDKCFAEDTPAERRELAAKVVRNLLHLIATVSPGAKKGSTAPFGWASLMVVEAGDLQPRSGADAFREALAQHDPTASLRSRAAKRLIGELEALDKAYGAELSRCIMSLDDVKLAGAEPKPLPELADWVAGLIKQGHC